MTDINLPPIAPTLIESSRSIGYSLESALADIIDNSIFAQATIIDISYCPFDNPYLYILDNGVGMDKDEINRAMQFGSRNPQEGRVSTDLGRFGLGLKTASFSQCRTLTLISKQGNQIEGRCWDIDHIIATGKWSLKVLGVRDLKKTPGYEDLLNLESGTLVIWQNLDRLLRDSDNKINTFSNMMELASNHLALVFHRYIEGEKDLTKITININKETIEPIDPFLRGRSQIPMDEEDFPFDDSYITVQGYILPHPSKLKNKDKIQLDKCNLRDKPGLYIYRNKRLLIWGHWFRLNPQDLLSNLTRIRVDIPNDCDESWSIDIKKSRAIPPESLKIKLKAIVNNLVERSKKTYTRRAKRTTGQDKNEIWEVLKTADNCHYYRINRENPIIEKIVAHNPDLKKSLYTLLEQIEKNFPTDKVRVDISNNNHISNNNYGEEDEIYTLLIDNLDMCSNLKEKQEYFTNKLSKMEIFCRYPGIIERVKKELQIDDEQC